MKNATRIKELKAQIKSCYDVMPQTQAQMTARDRNVFFLSRELESLENPTEYARNAAHWGADNIRM